MRLSEHTFSLGFVLLLVFFMPNPAWAQSSCSPSAGAQFFDGTFIEVPITTAYTNGADGLSPAACVYNSTSICVGDVLGCPHEFGNRGNVFYVNTGPSTVQVTETLFFTRACSSVHYVFPGGYEGRVPDLSIDIAADPNCVKSPLQITTSSLPTATVGSPYTANFAATGGTPPYVWFESGTLPSGLTFNSTSGTITGTPQVTGTFGFTVQLSDAGKTTVSRNFQIVVGPALTITSPTDNAYPQSHFVAVAGIGPPGHTLNVLVNSSSVGTVIVDSEGKWEALPFLVGTGTVQVQDSSTSQFSNTIIVHCLLPSFDPSPDVPTSNKSLLPLRHADILLSSSRVPDGFWQGLVSQYFLYGPLYTHTALYLGGDANGTPLIAEAVTAAEAGTLDPVHSVAFEHSLVWTDSYIVSAVHPQVALPGTTKDAIVAWAQNATSQKLPYWNAFTDIIIPLSAAQSLYDKTGLSPRLNLFLNLMNTSKYSTNKFICSTLVWRAYYEGTSHALDISTPNNMSALPGSVMANASAAFLAQLGAVFVVPETFAKSPKLSRVF